MVCETIEPLPKPESDGLLPTTPVPAIDGFPNGFPRLSPKNPADRGFLESSRLLDSSNVFSRRDGKLMAVFFLDIVLALLFFAGSVLFFLNIWIGTVAFLKYNANNCQLASRTLFL